MQTSLPAAAAAEGSLTAAAAAAGGEIVGAKPPGKGVVPVGTPIGGVQGVLGLEGPTAGCPVLVFAVPAWTDWLDQQHVCCCKQCTHSLPTRL